MNSVYVELPTRFSVEKIICRTQLLTELWSKATKVVH